MAIRAILTGVPPEIYTSVTASGGFIPSVKVLGRSYDWQKFGRVGLDTAWFSLHQAFSKAGAPLLFALVGDYHPAGGLDLFSQSSRGEPYLAYVSPELTKDVAAALAKFPIRQILPDLETDARYRAYCLAYFDDLVSFYKKAARKGEAVFISID